MSAFEPLPVYEICLDSYWQLANHNASFVVAVTLASPMQASQINLEFNLQYCKIQDSRTRGNRPVDVSKQNLPLTKSA